MVTHKTYERHLKGQMLIHARAGIPREHVRREDFADVLALIRSWARDPRLGQRAGMHQKTD
jgi:hypothetical protein